MTKLQTICCRFGLKQKIGALFRRAANAEPERTTYRNAWAATFRDWFPEILAVGTGRGYRKGTASVSGITPYQIAISFSGRTIIFSHQHFNEMFKMMWYVPSAMPWQTKRYLWVGRTERKYHGSSANGLNVSERGSWPQFFAWCNTLRYLCGYCCAETIAEERNQNS